MVRSASLAEDLVPYFAWDRSLTTAEIRHRLETAAGFDWVRLAAWIMREAAFADVWQFLTPQEVWQRRHELEPFLGRRRDFWHYILSQWHALGKV